MKEKTKNVVLYLIASIFAVFLICAFIFYFNSQLYKGLLWICYPVLTLIIIGIFLKKSNLILSQVIIIMIPDLLWIIDFVGILITGNSLLGIAKYFFYEGSLLKKMITLQHLFTLPLSIWALSLIKIKKNHKVLLISFAELFFFLILGMFPAMGGINCFPAAATCTSFIFPEIVSYPLLWLIVEFSFVLISYLILFSLKFIKKRKININQDKNI